MMRGARDLSPVLRYALARAQAGLVRVKGGWISCSDNAAPDEFIRNVTVAALAARGLLALSTCGRIACPPSRSTRRTA